jgi:Phosphoenolpyruvate carboxylase
LLARNRVLARSIHLRNPYVYPMSLIQVELLRRKQIGQDLQSRLFSEKRPSVYLQSHLSFSASDFTSGCVWAKRYAELNLRRDLEDLHALAADSPGRTLFNQSDGRREFRFLCTHWRGRRSSFRADGAAP